MDYGTIMKKRASFYGFLARLLEKEVSASVLEQLRGMRFPEDCGDGGMDEGYRLLASFLAAPPAGVQEELAADFAKVFLGAGEADGRAAYPYESVYTSPERLVMQDAWSRVRGVYAAKGIELETDSADLKEDHVSVELKFMAYLCGDFSEKHAGAGLKEQKDFLENHLLNWIGDFCADVERYARTDFYKGIARLLAGFLKQDQSLLTSLMPRQGERASYRLTNAQMNEILAHLKERYRICAPRVVEGRDGKNGPLVRYQEISTVEEIVTDRPSDFSAKEIYYPVVQTLLYFTDETCEESHLQDDKGILLFLRPCDINAMRRTDNIFLHNGGQADLYYKRLREKVRVVLMECAGGYENCFCVSMGSNVAGEYDAAVRLGGDGILAEVRARDFQEFFLGMESADFTPEFVKENRSKARIPVIDGIEGLKKASGLSFWKTFDEKCIGCGGCNTVCPTCSCFDTIDIRYDETSLDGERRRVWSSCMLESFTQTAGGAKARATSGANMRFKTLHKVYDYNKRFNAGENMCVGCGRCVRQCPKDISFLETLNGFCDAMEQAGEEGE